MQECNGSTAFRYAVWSFFCCCLLFSLLLHIFLFSYEWNEKTFSMWQSGFGLFFCIITILMYCQLKIHEAAMTYLHKILKLMQSMKNVKHNLDTILLDYIVTLLLYHFKDCILVWLYFRDAEIVNLCDLLRWGSTVCFSLHSFHRKSTFKSYHTKFLVCTMQFGNGNYVNKHKNIGFQRCSIISNGISTATLWNNFFL